jgi:hypothetical protein
MHGETPVHVVMRRQRHDPEPKLWSYAAMLKRSIYHENEQVYQILLGQIFLDVTTWWMNSVFSFAPLKKSRY